MRVTSEPNDFWGSNTMAKKGLGTFGVLIIRTFVSFAENSLTLKMLSNCCAGEDS